MAPATTAIAAPTTAPSTASGGAAVKPPAAAPAQSATAGASQALVYLQFADATQRTGVDQLRQQLERAGYKAPAAELVGQVPARDELRYFRPADEPAAKALAADLARWGLAGLQPRYAPGFAVNAQRQQFELWLARPAAAVELARLVQDLDASDKARRLAAGQALQSRWLASPEAIAAALALFDDSRIETLSENGRINALYYLSRTVITAWTPALAQRGRVALARIAAREKAGVAAGQQTRAEIDRLQTLLDAVQASGKGAQGPAGR